jgi:hypothetical protein
VLKLAVSFVFKRLLQSWKGSWTRIVSSRFDLWTAANGFSLAHIKRREIPQPGFPIRPSRNGPLSIARKANCESKRFVTGKRRDLAPIGNRPDFHNASVTAGSKKSVILGNTHAANVARVSAQFADFLQWFQRVDLKQLNDRMPGSAKAIIFSVTSERKRTFTAKGRGYYTPKMWEPLQQRFSRLCNGDVRFSSRD